MNNEIFKVAKLCINVIGDFMNTFLILLDLHELIMVAVEERIYSLKKITFKKFWKIQHYCLLVASFVFLENFVKKKFHRLVCSELNGETQRCHKVVIWLNNKIVFTKLNLSVESHLLIISLTDFINHTSFNLAVIDF